jgi:tripartite-type tricarboxylate transporter receptor subunit TctC
MGASRMSARRGHGFMRCGLVAAALSVTLVTTLAAVSTAAAADFYAGKTITVIVGFAPGGGVDTTARVVARHLVRFIPGQPGVVIQNMEAAAGLVAATHLNRRAVPDGLTLAVPGRSWFVEGIIKGAGVTFDPTRFSYIGSPGAVSSVMYVRSSTGVTSFAALKSSPRPLIFGALRSTTPTAMVPAMLANRGAPIRVVPSYVSTARVLLALEQGEVDGFFTVEDSFAHQEDLIRNKVVVPILQTKPKLAGIPLVRDALPESDGALLALVLALEDFGLPLVGPPGLPPERIDILRAAFLAMCRDPDYQAEAVRMNQPVGAPVGGAQLAAMINELAATAAPDVVAAYRRLGEGN